MPKEVSGVFMEAVAVLVLLAIATVMIAARGGFSGQSADNKPR